VSSSPAGLIFRNTAVQVVADLASKVLTFAFYVYMARKLGHGEFGDYVFALSLALLTTVVAGFGTDAILVREVAREGDTLRSLFWNAIGIKLAFGAVGVGAALAVAVVGDYGTEVRVAVVLLASASVLELVSKTVGATFQAFDDLGPPAVALFLQRSLTATVGITALAIGTGVVGVAAIYLGGAVAALAYSARVLGTRRIRPPIRLSAERARWLILASFPIGLAAIFDTIVFRADATILSLMKGNAEVGLYGAAYQMLETTLFLSYAFVAAVLPTLSRLDRGTRPSLGEGYESTLKVITALLLPLGTAFVLFAEPLTRLLYGAGYADAASAVRLLGGAAALYGISYLSCYILILQDRARILAWVSIAVAVENVGLNLLLIPAYSFDGAAAVTSISELTFAVVLTGFALRQTGPVSVWRIALGPTSACAGMGLVAFAIGANLVGLAVAAVVYLVLLLLVERRLYPDDVRMAIDSVRHRRAPLVEEPATGSSP
jgi:O-antigen/teichoic acid export membrane protein